MWLVHHTKLVKGWIISGSRGLFVVSHHHYTDCLLGFGTKLQPKTINYFFDDYSACFGIDK